MERAALLIEDEAGRSPFAAGASLDDDRVECMLNPSSVVIRRSAGISVRRSLAGAFSDPALADDPLLYTGGGVTEMELDLLFDVTLSGQTAPLDDVRLLTDRLTRVAENARTRGNDGLPIRVRFIWGKAWNFPAVIAALSQRFEHFDPSGAPRRAWLRLRLLRSEDPIPPAPLAADPLADVPPPGAEAAPDEPPEVPPPADDDRLFQMIGPGDGVDDPGGEGGEPPPSNWLPALAHWLTGDAAAWRDLARANGIEDPLHLDSGSVVRVPAEGTGAS
jgi:hypothetical protein